MSENSRKSRILKKTAAVFCCLLLGLAVFSCGASSDKTSTGGQGSVQSSTVQENILPDQTADRETGADEKSSEKEPASSEEADPSGDVTAEAPETTEETTGTDEGSSESQEQESSEGPDASENDETAEDEGNNGELSFGGPAYMCMRYINDHFPWRVTGNPEVTQEARDTCGAWIVKTMGNYGYTPMVQSWNHDNLTDTVNITSYIFRKPGRSGKRIMIGAHYDSRESRGAEDNGSGIGMALETAARFADKDLEYTLDFCFWDGEELRGCAGSYYYMLTCTDPENIALYINLDCLGAGDTMFVYGGQYTEEGVLVQDWGYRLAMETAAELGIDLHTIPPLAEPEFRAPTRTTGSDQKHFASYGIPYIYFEANAWVDANGVEQYPNGSKAYQFNSADPAFAKTEGQINHTEFDDLDILESIHPGRIREHLKAFSHVLTEVLLKLDRNGLAFYETDY